MARKIHRIGSRYDSDWYQIRTKSKLLLGWINNSQPKDLDPQIVEKINEKLSDICSLIGFSEN